MYAFNALHLGVEWPVSHPRCLAWNGPWFPDMKQILGTYFDQYSRASQAQRTTRIRRGPVMINEAGLIVQIGGHMRAFAGRAYVPGMLPAGVSAENIQ